MSLIAVTYYFHIFKCDSSECPGYDVLVGPAINQSADSIPCNVPSVVDLYKDGKDSWEKFLRSKLIDATKRRPNVPFRVTAQTALNTGILLLRVGCSRPRLLYAQRIASAGELKTLKRFFHRTRNRKSTRRGVMIHFCNAAYIRY